PIKVAHPVSEDCLYLNIFVPLDVDFSSPLGAPLPVMVWIHGGDFIAGSASKPLYDGRFISNSTSTVVVSLEYRLGMKVWRHFTFIGPIPL
uniref:Carboxylesterase type B domain-containing protein n=1 Tax=Cyclopterus lumpus TaxID=8103 RepID=A0A8C3B2R0_CYCLU